MITILNQVGKSKFISISIVAIIIGTLLVLGLISYAKNGIQLTTLSIVTKSSDNKFSLSGAKYTIKKIIIDENNNEVEEDAKDYYGNLVGNLENIDGADYKIIESNENGEINLDLPAGKYRVTEIVAPTGYKLNENNTYDIVLDKKGDYSLFYTNKEWEKEFKIDETRVNPVDIKETTGEEYIALVEVVANYTVPAEDKEDNQPSELKSGPYIFRYNANNKIKEIVYLYENLPRDNSETNIKILNETDQYYIFYSNERIVAFDKYGELVNDFGCFIYDLDMFFSENYYVSKQTGDITIVGNAYGENTIPAEQTSGNKEITFGEEDLVSDILIQLNSEGKVNWVIDFKDTEIISNIMQIDSNIVFDLVNQNEIILDSNNGKIQLEPGAYNLTINNGKVKDSVNIVDSFKGQLYSDNDFMTEYITSDFGTLSFIGAYDEYNIQAENTVNNEPIQLNHYQMYIIKLNSEDKVEWAMPINLLTDSMLYYKEVSNGYIINAPMSGIINADYVLDGNNIDLGNQCFATIKIDKSGKVMHVEQTPIEEDTEEIYHLDEIIELDNRKYVQLKTKENPNPKSIIEGRDIRHFNDTKLEKYVEIEEKRDEIDKQILTVTNGKEDSLQIIKQDSRTAELLPGSKFTIKKVTTNADGTVTKENAINNDGELVGKIENINGEELRVVTTNENGEINESLPVGKYEIVEVKAPEGYYLKPTVEENTYEAEITEKQEEKKEWKESWSRIVGEGHNEPPSRISSIYEEYSDMEILKKDETGVIVYLVTENLSIPAEDTVNNVEINANGPVMMKYNLENKVEWVKNTIEIENIDTTDDGRYIFNGYCRDTLEISADSTINNKPIIMEEGSATLVLNEDFIITSVFNFSSVGLLDKDIYYIQSYNDITLPEISNTNENEIKLQSGTYIVKINKQFKLEKIISYLGDVSRYDLENYIFNIADNEITYKKVVEKNETITTLTNKKIELISGKEYLIQCNYNGDILEVFTGMDSILSNLEKNEEGYLIEVYNENEIVVPSENTIGNEEAILKNYMYLKLDNNLKLINYTIDFWEDSASFSSYLNYIDKLEDGYLLKVVTKKGLNIPAGQFSSEDILLNPATETILKVDKNLKILEKLNEFEMKSWYVSSEEYVTSTLEESLDGIYMLYRKFPYATVIPAEETVSNKEIKVSAGKHNIIYNSEFKVIGIDITFPEYITNNGYIAKEYNSKDITIPSDETAYGQEIAIKKGYSYILYNKEMKVQRVLTGYNFESYYSGSELENMLYIENVREDGFTIKPEDTENNQEIYVEADSSYMAIINVNTLKIKKLMYVPDNMGYIAKLADGYYVSGNFDNNKLIPGEYTESGQPMEINNINEECDIKYNEEGKIQYVVSGEIIKQEDTTEGYTVLSRIRNYDTNEYRYTLTVFDKKWNIKKVIENFLLNTSDGGYIYNVEYKTNSTITKENNTTGRDIFVNKGKYLVKENSAGKIEWLIEKQNFVQELVEINNTYFGGFKIPIGQYNFELGFLQISKETVQDQLANKVVLNVTNESDVGKIIVKYVDRETNQEIASSEEFEDRVGVAYETEAKNIQYYNLEGTPENATGTVESGTTEVIYYYDKQDFNIKTDKTISELYVNGEKQDIKNNKNNIFQVSVHRKELENTELKIKYIIKIENTGEIPGTAGIVTDQIPEGLEFYAEDNADYWQLKDGVAITDKLDGELIEPGEYKELEIVLRCTNLGNKVGLQTNKAVAENMKNDPNFEDSNSEDDLGECELLISVGLGGQDIVKILLISIVVLIVVAKIINKFRRSSK